MADQFLNLTLAERREVLESAFDRGLIRSVALLEKDVWLVWTLQALFAAPFANHFVFKGGTSLSKAYNAIQRFSEDVDLTYDIRKLADEQAGRPDALTAAEAKSLGRRIREKLLPGFSTVRSNLTLMHSSLRPAFRRPLSARTRTSSSSMTLLRTTPPMSGHGLS